MQSYLKIIQRTVLLAIIVFFSSFVQAQQSAVFKVKDFTKVIPNSKLSFSNTSVISNPDVIVPERRSTVREISPIEYEVRVDSLTEPKLLKIYKSRHGVHEVLVSPGDELNVVITETLGSQVSTQIKFEGKNQANYNVGSLIGQLNKVKVDLSGQMELSEIMRLTRNSLAIKRQLIDNYAEVQGNTKIVDLLRIASEASLFTALNSHIQQLKLTFKEEDLRAVRQQIVEVQKGHDIMPNEMMMYITGMRNSYTILNTALNPDDNFNKSLNLINSLYKGYTKDYLLSDLYYSFGAKYSGDPQRMQAANAWFEQNRETLSHTEYNFYLDVGYSMANVVRKPLPDSIANLKLYNLTNKEITLATILKQYEGKAIVLDHWATWCGPCIAEFPAATIKSKELGDAVVFLYFSSDKKEAIPRMKELIAEHQINSYRFDEEAYKIYKRFFNITAIPRYMMLNEKGLVIDAQFKRPSMTDFVKSVQRNIEK